jgi:F-type H+-transporting ATPase subunit b
VIMRTRRYLAAFVFAALLGGVPVLSRAQSASSTASPESSSAASGERSTPEAQSPEKSTQEKDENDAYRHSPMVTKLGGMMGMNPEQSATAFEITNFLLLSVAVLYGLVKLVPGTLRARNSAIQKHLVDARTATEEASARLSSVESRLGKLDVEIAALRAQAEQDSVRDEARIKASVEEEKKRILAAADQEIASATTQAQKSLQRFAADLAIEQAARKLVVSAETDRLLVQSFAMRLTGDESKKGQN